MRLRGLSGTPAGVRIIPARNPAVFASLDHRLMAVTPDGVLEGSVRWLLHADDGPAQFPIKNGSGHYSGFLP